MYVKEGHEDADLYCLPIEKVILKMSFDFQDFSIRWRDDATLGGRGGSGRVSEKRDDEEGDHTKDSGEINLWGNLEGSSENGFRIITDHILIHEKTRRLTTEKPVMIFGPFFSVYGQGLCVDLEKETLKILSNVHAVINEGPLT